MDATKPRRNLRPSLARVAVLAGAFGLCLLGLEILVRIFLPWYNPSNQVFLTVNEDGLTTGIPNTNVRQGTPKGDFMIGVRFNRHGFRDGKDYTESTTNDVFVAGDSYSMGWGVEEDERYSNLLEKRFGTRFYNIAAPDDIRGYARMLDHVVQRGAAVRHVLVGICMENDLWDYRSITNTYAVYRTQMVYSFRHRLARFFKGRSALWNCASFTLQKFPAVRRVFEKVGIARNVDQLTHKNVATPQVIESSRDEVVKFATNYNSVVLIVPSRALWVGKNTEIERKAHDEFTRGLREAGLKLVDMRPVLEKTGDPGSFYFKNDPHWNVKGQALAADTLAELLAREDPWKQLLVSPASQTSAPAR